MKKYLCILLCLILYFSTSCMPNKVDNHDDGNIVSSASEQKRLVDSGKYYRIFLETFVFYYEIYNSEGEVVLFDRTDRPLRINMINSDVVDIAIGMGTGLTVHKYYSAEKNIFSEEYEYVFANQNELIAYIFIPKKKPMKDRKVVVQNVFDKEIFYKEFQLDFSYVDTPVIEAEFSEDGTSLQLTYLSGEDQKEISATLDLG